MKWNPFVCTVNVADLGGGGPIMPSVVMGPPAPTPVLPTGGNLVGNTYWYSDVAAWRSAGSPGGNNEYSVKIGTPPKAGEPETGVKTPSGKVIPYGQAPNGVTATGEPRPSGSTKGPAPSVSTQQDAAGLAGDVSYFNRRVETYQASVQVYDTKREAFDKKWAHYVAGDTFNGTDAQFKEYQRDFGKLDKDRLDLSMEERELSARERDINRKREAELSKYVKIGADEYILKDDFDKLDSKYQDVLKTQGFAALNGRIDADNKAAIKQALVSTFDRFKNEDGRVDLTKAVKIGLSERTIAIAYGEDQAREAVKDAGPAPAGGWGPKGPSLPQAVGVVTAETLFPPSKQWVEPELHYRATGMDWAIGVAQIALFAVPAVGAAGRLATVGGKAAMAARGVEFGIQAGATVVFTKDTIDNFDELKKNPWQLAFALGMDALVAGSALRSAGRFHADLQARQLASIESKARRITVAHTIDTFGGTEPAPKATFTRVPTQPLTPGEHLPVPRAEMRPAVLRSVMNDVARAIRTGDKPLLQDAGRRLQLIGKSTPESPVAKVLQDRGKSLETHAQEYIDLGKKSVTPAEQKALQDAIKANQQQADLIERQLKRGIKSPETRKVAQEALKEAKRQVQVATKEATKPLPKQRIELRSTDAPVSPSEAPTTTSKALTVKPKPPEPKTSQPKRAPEIRSKPSTQSDIQVIVRPVTGGAAVTGFVSFPMSDRAGQQRYLEAIRRTELARGFVFKVVPAQAPETRSSTELQAQRERLAAARQGTRAGQSTGGQTKGATSTSQAAFTETRPAQQPKHQPATSVQQQPSHKQQPVNTTTTTRVHEPQPVPETKPQPKPKSPAPTPIPTPGHPRPSEPVKAKEKPKVRPSKADKEQKKPWTPEDIAGAVALRAGFGWWLKRRDGAVRFFNRLPEGAQAVQGGKGSGYRSVQTVQGTPMNTEIRLGFMTARVRKPSREPGRRGAVDYAAAPHLVKPHRTKRGGGITRRSDR